MLELELQSIIGGLTGFTVLWQILYRIPVDLTGVYRTVPATCRVGVVVQRVQRADRHQTERKRYGNKFHLDVCNLFSIHCSY